MKIRIFLGALAVAVLTMLNSCKEDEKPPVAGISFELDVQEVTESDGTPESFHPEESEDGVGRIITAKLVFDRALSRDVVLEFDIDGSARENATSSELNDFEIVEEGDNVLIDGNQITITKGATEALFSVRLFEDSNLEFEQNSPLNDNDIPYETIEISLQSVVSGPGKLGENLEHEIRILEDDAYVFLQWDPQDQAGANAGDVNMDLFIFVNDNIAARSNFTNDETTSELITIPAGIDDITLDMSYVYRAGTSDDLDFQPEIGNFGGTITTTGGETGVVYADVGTYTLANLNAYVDEDAPGSQIEQSITKSGLNYTNATEITIPTTGSRTAPKAPRARQIEQLRKKIVNSKRRVLGKD